MSFSSILRDRDNKHLVRSILGEYKLKINKVVIFIIFVGEWNNLYSDLEPKKLLGRRKVVGPGLCAEEKAQRVIIHERTESWIILDVEDKVWYHGQPILAEK